MSDNEKSVPTEGVDYGDTMIVWPSKGKLPGGNTLMIQQVLHEPVWLSRMKAEDLRALTPLIYAHVSPYGIFELDMETRLPIDVVA